ncbi:MAG: glycine zipper domain-containing protein, partial [Gammaproteobacteria bacterium]|nr:glycine zipper domain-containing protein [Gammaproteobacteria bacterium]
MSSRLPCVSMMFLVAVIVAGCETINPYTGETQTSKATKGALIGAAAGAVVGLVTGDNAVERRQHALIGAGIGALAGGGIGYYMDVQEAKLRQKRAGTVVSVTRVGDNITLNMPGNITFETASA